MNYIKTTQASCRIVAALFIGLLLISCSSTGGGGAVTTPPTVSSTSPANSATGVAVNAAMTAPFIGTAPVITRSLNDTGIAASQCYQHRNIILAACGSAGAATLFNNTDGLSGRDANADTNDNTDGKLGFSFTSVPASGSDPGGCVQDNVTGLMWEVKTADGGLRDKARAYTNYDSALTVQKTDGLVPTQTDGSVPTQAEINAETNSVGFKNSVNALGLCGFSDWRLPTFDELHGIVDYGVATPGPAIDTNWFPNTLGHAYWTASPYVDNPVYAWSVSFTYGYVNHGVRDAIRYVRLVRSDQ